MRNCSCLLFFLLLFGSGPARAQQESLESATFKQRLRSQYLHNDTAQALVNLYGKRQGGGASWIVSAALAAVRIATAPNNSTSVNGVVVREQNNSGLAFVFALPFAAYGVGKILHYSNGNLERLLTSYAAVQPLPRAVRRKLKPRFFAQPIIEYQPVPVKAAK